MTTFIARHGDRTAGSNGALQARMQRFTHSLVAVGAIVLDSIEASRALGSAHTGAERRAVVDRFAAETRRDADRSAA